MEVLTPSRKRTFTDENPEGGCSPSLGKKRLKAQHNQQTTFLLFQEMEREELMNLIVNIIKEHPAAEQTIIRNIPKATVEKSIKIVTGLSKKFIAAIPYSKFGIIVFYLGHDKSDYAYNRTRPQQQLLSSQIQHYLDLFTLPTQMLLDETDYSIDCFKFLDFCTCLVHKLPNWESEELTQEFKGTLYLKLARHWRIVINETGKKIVNGILMLI
jgi:hypothetical protein